MPFSNTTLLGNWFEERLQSEFFFKLFLRKRDRKELLVQKARTTFSNLLCERDLAISGVVLLYGYDVQVVASDTIANIDKETGEPLYGLALSSVISSREVDSIQNISDGCLMTLSPITTPCCRNTFVIQSCEDETLRGEKVKYGEEFLLKAENYAEPDAVPLYVRYTTKPVPEPNNRMPIRLSSSKDSNCRWTALPLYISDRLEGMGSPIPTGTKLVIKSCAANENLCVMNQSWLQTFFGPECGITCRDRMDTHRRYTSENVFKLVSDIAAKSAQS